MRNERQGRFQYKKLRDWIFKFELYRKIPGIPKFRVSGSGFEDPEISRGSGFENPEKIPENRDRDLKSRRKSQKNPEKISKIPRKFQKISRKFPKIHRKIPRKSEKIQKFQRKNPSIRNPWIGIYFFGISRNAKAVAPKC